MAEKETEWRYIPKVTPKTSLSDPEATLIAHSLKERDRTEEEVRKRERKIKRGGESECGKWRAPAGILNHSRPRHHQRIRSRFTLSANDHWLTWIPAAGWRRRCRQWRDLSVNKCVSVSQMSVCFVQMQFQCVSWFVSWICVYAPAWR